MATNADLKEYLETLKDDADKNYYIGPTLTFLMGFALGLTPADPKIGLIDVIFVGMLFGGMVWFIFRAIKKWRAEKKYEDAFNQYYEEFTNVRRKECG